MGCTSSAHAVQNNGNPNATPATVNVRPIAEKQVTFSVAELQVMRKEFWESRVDGSPEMYVALRSVCEAILSEDSALADAILEASNITTVDATLSKCYDERGHEYNIPTYCWSSQGPASMASSSKTAQFDPTKVKANIKNANQPLVIKVQVNPGDRRFELNANTSNSVAELKALIATESTVKTDKNMCTEPVRETRQRMIFMGKELKNTQYLGDVGVDDTRVVQVFLRKE
mmetsp:Transcript_18423/g.30700  ORF Transcript_18423/g.30700 Transcript_18423/m.30700 type:complete len:230 (+) Transcript_18423:255-944(+)